MAKVLLRMTEDQYKGNDAYDLWSLGCILYQLVAGKPLWLLTDTDHSIPDEDLKRLANWTEKECQYKIYDQQIVEMRSPVQLAGLDLVRKLLTSIPEARIKNFPLGMVSVRDHPFLLGKSLDDPTLEGMNAKLDRIEKQLQVHEQLLQQLTTDIKSEWRYSREVLLRGMFEATEVKTPTAFVILPELLPEEKPGIDQEFVKADGTGFDFKAVLSEDMKEYKERVDVAVKWAKRLRKEVSGVLRGNSEQVFESVRKGLGDLVKAEQMCLTDEVTGLPIRKKTKRKPYPIEIRTPSELVPKLYL
jgi:hypothetical protein